MPGGLVTWSFDAGANYNTASSSALVTITPIDASISVLGYSTPYDGMAHGLSGTASGVLADGDLSSFFIYGVGVTNVPGGLVTWSFDACANYNTANSSALVTITKVNAAVVVTPYNVVYDGSPHTAGYTITGVGVETGATVGTVDVSNTMHTDVGVYVTDTWSFTGTGNYNDISATMITDRIRIPAPTASIVDDPIKGGKMLLVCGTDLGDQIVVNPGSNYSKNGAVAISYFDGVAWVNFPGSPFTPATGTRFSRIVIKGKGGNDDLQVAGSILQDAWLYGDDGNDRLKGGAGANVLLGGANDDTLIGGGSRNLLIGGTGVDRLVGNGGDDILIADSTTWDTNALALCKIMAEWTSNHSYANRVNYLRGTAGGLNAGYYLTAATVVADGSKDTLTGCSGQDLFFAQNADSITDLHVFDTVKKVIKTESAFRYL